ncbi:hypothetical protein Mic7113_1598 [Allocoleopsis franciscana PCC 7113]|uniref:Uncharacterized protein n=1 Tax=Allocoleopsis franciscana PCC 7113 TaxID=1173027 RepID=K9WAR0_9CYAN|nr:hypothetical protein Mic7113_1598 [Allocoleopsis franciscana PCC 7113]
MGYYDFNDHFWSPLEVCASAPKKEPSEKKFKITNLVQTILSAGSQPSKTLVKKAN